MRNVPGDSGCRSRVRTAWVAGWVMTMVAVGGGMVRAGDAGSVVDTLVFGDAKSEKAHALDAPLSETFKDAAGRVGRRLLPHDPPLWYGGVAEFTVKVDPEKQNYATFLFNGDEATPNKMAFFIDGKMVGYRHLGDIDMADTGGGKPCPGQDYYSTGPLPLALTKGKTTLRLQLRANGPNGGGGHFERFQGKMESPARGLYTLAIHTDEYYAPSAPSKIKRPARLAAPAREGNDPGVVEQLRNRVRHELRKMWRGGPAYQQAHLLLLAYAYHAPWTDAHKNPEVVKRVIASIDAAWGHFRNNPQFAERETGTPAGDWIGMGWFAESLCLVADGVDAAVYDATIEHGDSGPVKRRDAWGAMFAHSRDFNRNTRRGYTNQTMIKDLYGIYYNNAALLVIGSDLALPEEAARHYLYEAVGLEPWNGSGLHDPREKPPFPGSFRVMTPKGLSREFGYVGGYGEILDWMTKIHDATRRPMRTGDGDPKIRDQLVRALHARAVFRYPSVDDEGFRAMRLQSALGWRDGAPLPGDILYTERPGWDGTLVSAIGATMDPAGIGYVQHMIADGRFFDAVAAHAGRPGYRGTPTMILFADDLERILAAPPTKTRLPMADGQPDFVFTDETNGVVALRRGDEIFYASVYWRARHAINSLARVHYILPDRHHVATVYQDVAFTPHDSGPYIRPNWTVFGFGNGGTNIHYPERINSANHGEPLPVARVLDPNFRLGLENMYAGRGDVHRLTYGPYFIAMNMTDDRTLPVEVPAAYLRAEKLHGDGKVAKSMPLAPQSTLVLRRK